MNAEEMFKMTPEEFAKAIKENSQTREFSIHDTIM